MEASVFTSSQISHELIRRRPPATARNTHRSTYQTYGLGFHRRYFSRLLRIYIDTPQIEVELYGGTLRQIFMLGATNFQYKKSIDRSYTGRRLTYAGSLPSAKDWGAE